MPAQGEGDRGGAKAAVVLRVTDRQLPVGGSLHDPPAQLTSASAMKGPNEPIGNVSGELAAD